MYAHHHHHPQPYALQTPAREQPTLRTELWEDPHAVLPPPPSIGIDRLGVLPSPALEGFGADARDTPPSPGALVKSVVRNTTPGPISRMPLRGQTPTIWCRLPRRQNHQNHRSRLRMLAPCTQR